MITPKEYYLFCFGAITTIDLPEKLKSKVLYQMGKNAGLKNEEMQEIINEIEGTLKWKVQKDLENMKF